MNTEYEDALDAEDELSVVNTKNQIQQQQEEEKDFEYIKMDYSLETAEERNEKVKEIIANTPPERLTPRYLDKLAEYLTQPITKQEKKERHVLTENRLVTINKRETSYEGLVGKLENGEDGIYNMMINDKNVLLSPKVEITQEDLDTIPGLKELRDIIEQIEEDAKWATGRRRYLLKKQVIEMRQQQYILKNSFHQSIYSRSTVKTLAKLDLSENVWIDAEGEIHSSGIVNLFEPAHIVALLCNYLVLKEDTWNKFDSDMRWMLIDLENVTNKALKEKYPLYYDLLIYKINGKQNAEIQQLLLDKYGIKHSVEYISALWRNKIPKLICDQTKNDWLEWHFTFKERGRWKKCSRCGQIKLAHNRFFSKNNTSKDGFYSICKECRNKAAKIKRK